LVIGFPNALTRPAFAPVRRSLDHEVGVLGVLADVFAHEGTDDVDFVSLFPGPAQGALGEGGS